VCSMLLTQLSICAIGLTLTSIFTGREEELKEEEEEDDSEGKAEAVRRSGI
jgi:hypothetical protein